MPETPDAFEAFLNLPPLLLMLIIAVPSAAIMLVTIRFSRRRDTDREYAPLANTSFAVIGGAFIFVGAFALVTSWENEAQLVGSVTSEFTSVTSLAEDLGGIPGESSAQIASSLSDYATLVRETEIGSQGIVAPNPEAQRALALIEKSVTSVAESPGLTDHQVDNLYSHMESVKDARKDRLMISVPNLPLNINILLLVSALFTLLSIGLFPSTKVRWQNYFYGAGITVVTTAMILAVLVLQSPANVAVEAARPIDMFLSSMELGGANIGIDGQQAPTPGEGELPPPGEGEPPPPADGELPPPQ